MWKVRGNVVFGPHYVFSRDLVFFYNNNNNNNNNMVG
jgi:hypothetical protein